MAVTHVFLHVVLVLLAWHSAQCQDDEDDIKGPLMPMKPGGEMYTTAEIITEHKHNPESHTVTTEDGYILSLFRIVPKTTDPPASAVLLQHGFLASSDGWVTDSDALAYKLCDAGYDVWIGNIRGNAYSRSHDTLKPEEKDFWNFSWHEMGTKDVPAVIDYILQKTGQSALHYIGHSMGTTMSYVMVTVRPEYNKKLKSLIGLAPAVFLSKLSEMIGPDGMAGQMASKYMDEFKQSGKVEVFPRKDLATDNKTQITCNDVEESFRDMCSEKMEEAQVVLGGPYLPAGQSFKTMDHFYQMSVAGVMKFYNLSSPEENKKAYGSEEPPSYIDNFKQITAPTLLWSAEADQLIMPKDVDDLVPLLPNMVADNRIKDSECFDHVAFLFPRKKSCIPLREKVYKEIIEAIQKLDKQ